MKFRELCKYGCEILKKNGIEEAEIDSRLLLLSAFSFTTAEYLLYEKNTPEEILGKEKAAEAESKYRAYVKERAKRRPVQYILGRTEFMGLEIKCREGVLIPRQDTEILCEQVLSENKNQRLSILDMCSGSGCIASALSYYGRYNDITAADISETAVELSEINLNRNSKSGYKVIKTDLFDAFRDTEGNPIQDFDIIVSNPPYIRSCVIEELQPEVRDFEPRLALDGTEDGLYFYKKISNEAREFLSDGGRLYYEIGYDQAEELVNILTGLGYEDIRVIKDLAGLDRVVEAVFRRN